ncbi:exodeoxyribonuclease 7 large subunit [Mycobacterium tuberculosis]|nr:exodeoxyribonuclease 7 large subunit [Mycobacterium tuberculosis]
MEELWCFNDEQVARAIAAFPKPVISAVGHETDFTIADFVADLRAPTPSAAAELAVPDQGALVEKLGLLERRLRQAIRRGLDERRRELQKITQSRVLRDPYLELNRRHQDLDWLEEKLLRCGTQRLTSQRDYLTTLLGKLDALSPLATLQRGYAIVRRESGHIIKDEAQVIADEVVRVRLARGSLCCRIIGKEIES